MRKLFFTLMFFTNIAAFSQELDCNISVSSSRIQGTNKQIFTTLQESVTDFMNNTVWSTFSYGTQERVECNFTIEIIEQISPTEFKGKFQIQSRRPVYASTYNSVLLNYVDEDIQFTYQEFEPIQLSENTFVSNLSSLLSFYAYIILGLDSDSFESGGGDVFFAKAEQIVNAAQSSGYIGWQGSDDTKRKNRYWLMDNILDTEYKPLRDFYYTYHRQGLDLMEKDVDRGRNGVTEAILMLEKFNENKPDPFTYLLSVLLATKSNEFIDIYSGAPQPEMQKIKKILLDMDPANSRKYNEMGEK